MHACMRADYSRSKAFNSVIEWAATLFPNAVRISEEYLPSVNIKMQNEKCSARKKVTQLHRCCVIAFL